MSQKRKSVAAITTEKKKQKVIPVALSSKVTKKVGENLPVTGIKKFFTVLEKSESSQSSNTSDTSASTSDTWVGLSTSNTITNPSSIGNETPGTSVQSNCRYM